MFVFGITHLPMLFGITTILEPARRGMVGTEGGSTNTKLEECWLKNPVALLVLTVQDTCHTAMEDCEHGLHGQHGTHRIITWVHAPQIFEKPPILGDSNMF